MEWF